MDITGNEAVVKVEDLYLGLRFTDYLSLLLIDNNWVIVNKIYYYPNWAVYILDTSFPIEVRQKASKG